MFLAILRKMNSQGFLKKEYQNLIRTRYDKTLNQDLSLNLFPKASHVQNAIYTWVTLTCGVSLSPGVDTGCFQHRYTDFWHTNLGVPKSNLN